MFQSHHYTEHVQKQTLSIYIYIEQEETIAEEIMVLFSLY